MRRVVMVKNRLARDKDSQRSERRKDMTTKKVRIQIAAVLFMLAVACGFGCSTTPPPTKTTKTITTEVVQQQEAEAQYVEVSADKLANAAFADDFKNKYVIFDAFGFPAKSADRFGAKNAKDFVVVAANTKATNLGQGILLLVPKAQSDMAFALTPLQPIRVYGKSLPVAQGNSFIHCSIVEVRKMELRNDPAADTANVQMLIDFASQAMKRPEFNDEARKGFLQQLWDAKPGNETQKQAIDALIKDLEKGK
jgi:hypothetical protein